MLNKIIFFAVLQGIVRSKDCNVQGNITTFQKWYGFIAFGRVYQSSDSSISRLNFTFEYPLSSSTIDVLLYFDDQADLLLLKNTESCFSKVSILRHENNQIIPLSTGHPWSGCKAQNDTKMLVCNGSRSFRSEKRRTWFVAVSSCTTMAEINLKYNLTFINVLNGNCEGNATGGSRKVYQGWIHSCLLAFVCIITTIIVI